MRTKINGALVCVLSATVAAVTDQNSLPKCPNGTFARYGRNARQHKHCVCPDTHICEGCSSGCSKESNAMKGRCVFGFKPSCGKACRCQKSGGDEPKASTTAYHDRRHEPFCPGKIKQPSSEKTFVFVVSNGHTGSTYLGQAANWRRMFGNKIISGLLAQHEKEANKSFVMNLGWNKDFCDASDKYVQTKKIPSIESALDSTGTRTWFGAGHQIITGMVPALVKALGDNGRFIRLRRNKKDVAFSYSQKRGGPCTAQCIYCICPLDASARIPVRGEVWEKMSKYQRYLWFVDELEAQWQATVKTFPGIKYIEVDWDTKLTSSMFQKMAAFSGYPDYTPLIADKKVTKVNHHVRKDRKRNETWMAEQIEEYRKIMEFDQCTKYTCLPALGT